MKYGKINNVNVYHYTEFNEFYNANRSLFYRGRKFYKNITVDNRKIKTYYYDIPMSFDIETTSISKEIGSYCYIWQFQITDHCFIGRSLSEYVDFINILSDKLNLSENKKIIVYVHNLSYEFQFIKDFFIIKNVLATKTHQPITAETDTVIYKCSLKLSGMSLDTLSHTVGAKKLTGYLDYDKKRNSSTVLTVKEIKYCIEDVNIIIKYITEQRDIYGEIKKIPNTLTGRVRKELRDNVTTEYKNIMKNLTISGIGEYQLLKEAYQGGFTHSNYTFTDITVKDIVSYDFNSSYPARFIYNNFPMSRGVKVNTGNITHDKLNEYINKYCCIMKCKLTELCVKEEKECIIPKHKCKAVNSVINNNRIMSADELIITLTDVDFRNIIKFYDYEEIYISDLYIYKRGRLPDYLINTVIKWYREKNELKNVKGSETQYNLRKILLNSLYGCSVTDVIQDTVTYHNGWLINTGETPDDKIKKYNDSDKLFFYPWGVFCTAYARNELFNIIYDMGKNYIYSDTDSVKCVRNEKTEAIITGYNLKYIEMKKKSNIYIDKIGEAEFDGHYDIFKTLGSKRYIYTADGVTHITLSGIRNKGKKYIINKYGKYGVYKYFNNGLAVPADDTGKLTHFYIDTEPTPYILTDYNGVTEEVIITSSVYLENAPFSLTVDEAYINFLLGYRSKVNGI